MRRGTPGDADRESAGRVAGHDVEGGIADVDGALGAVIQFAEGEPDGVGVGFVPGGAVGADDDVEERGEPHVGEGAIGQVVGLARDDAERVARGVEALDEGRNPVEGAGEAVVVLVLEGAVGADQVLKVVVVARVLAELPHERSADRGHPLLDGRARPLARVEGVLHRPDEEFERVDEGAVQVEEDDGVTVRAARGARRSRCGGGGHAPKNSSRARASGQEGEDGLEAYAALR